MGRFASLLDMGIDDARAQINNRLPMVSNNGKLFERTQKLGRPPNQGDV
jgi:hypothetical protein